MISRSLTAVLLLGLTGMVGCDSPTALTDSPTEYQLVSIGMSLWSCPPCDSSDVEAAIEDIAETCPAMGNWLSTANADERIAGYDYDTRPEDWFGTLGAIDGPLSEPNIWYERNNNDSLDTLIDTLRHEYGHWDLDYNHNQPNHTEADADWYISNCPGGELT